MARKRCEPQLMHDVDKDGSEDASEFKGHAFKTADYSLITRGVRIQRGHRFPNLHCVALTLSNSMTP